MIDILMATYQGEQYLKAQIDSIINQTYKDWHLWIGDDASTDNTLKIVSDFKDSRITVLGPDKRFGVIGNFSRLMHVGSSQYTMFSDQDDIWLPNKIELTLKKMQKLEEQRGSQLPLLIHTDLTVVDCDLKQIHPSFWTYAHLDSSRFVTLNRLLTQNVVTGCTMMLNRPLLELSSPIPEGVCMHDWWIAITAAAFGYMDTVSEPTMLYRQHGKNSVGAKQYGFLNGLLQHKQNKASKNSIRFRRSTQAALFLERHQKNLPSQLCQMLKDYQIYCNGSFFEKCLVMKKYEFYKNGWMRNVYELLSLG